MPCEICQTRGTFWRCYRTNTIWNLTIFCGMNSEHSDQKKNVCSRKKYSCCACRATLGNCDYTVKGKSRAIRAQVQWCQSKQFNDSVCEARKPSRFEICIEIRKEQPFFCHCIAHLNRMHRTENRINRKKKNENANNRMIYLSVVLMFIECAIACISMKSEYLSEVLRNSRLV